jgi:hypothetical protein
MTTADTIEMLERAYRSLQGQGLTTSKAAFSEKWLGRAPSYLSSMRARNRHVSPEVLDFFYRQLERYVVRFGTASGALFRPTAASAWALLLRGTKAPAGKGRYRNVSWEDPNSKIGPTVSRVISVDTTVCNQART